MSRHDQPDTFIEEVGPGPRRIEAAPTSVTVLLGRCGRGPADEPTPVGSVAELDAAFPGVRGSSLRRAARDFFSHGGRRALAVRVTDASSALTSLDDHDWQLLVADPGVVDLADAHELCVRHQAFLVCDAADDGTLPAGLGGNAAAYFPPFASRGGVRPSAPAVAGVFARTDAEHGVWKAPAGDAAVVTGELSRELSRREIDALQLRKVNALRRLPAGTVVWGARTASDDPEWKYVPVRRLFLFLERSIDQGLQWVVFEPNGEPLWAAVRASVDNFLLGLWQRGALVGTTPKEGYVVRCDRSTMTQSDIDAGRLVVMVGVAPARPAEFVIFRIALPTVVSP